MTPRVAACHAPVRHRSIRMHTPSVTDGES